MFYSLTDRLESGERKAREWIGTPEGRRRPQQVHRALENQGAEGPLLPVQLRHHEQGDKAN